MADKVYIECKYTDTANEQEEAGQPQTKGQEKKEKKSNNAIIGFVIFIAVCVIGYLSYRMYKDFVSPNKLNALFPGLGIIVTSIGLAFLIDELEK